MYIPVRGSALNLIEWASAVSCIRSSLQISFLHPASGSVLIQYVIVCFFWSISCGKVRLISSNFDWGMKSQRPSPPSPHQSSTFITALTTLEGVKGTPGVHMNIRNYTGTMYMHIHKQRWKVMKLNNVIIIYCACIFIITYGYILASYNCRSSYIHCVFFSGQLKKKVNH